ncbi:MAG: nucleoside deaminase [Rhizobiaceae bacterium]
MPVRPRTRIFHRNLNRRQFAGRFGIFAVPAGLGFSISTANSSEFIEQPDLPDDIAFLERAFEMRQLAIEKGDQQYGAVVVRENKIIGQSWSKVVIDNDPTAHAEMAAIRDAARRTGSRNLDRAILYSSSRPCPMCEAAAYWANIKEMIHGRTGQKAGTPSLCG